MLDEMMARIEGSKINLNEQVDLTTMSNWEVACFIGRTVSLGKYGYEDNFDACDWTQDAQYLRQDFKSVSRAELLKWVEEY